MKRTKKNNEKKWKITKRKRSKFLGKALRAVPQKIILAHSLESAKIPFTLPMAKAETMLLVLFLVCVSFFLPASKEKVDLVSGEVGFSFWFRFLPETSGWGIFATLECSSHTLIFASVWAEGSCLGNCERVPCFTCRETAGDAYRWDCKLSSRCLRGCMREAEWLRSYR